MKTNELRRRTWGAATCALALLTLTMGTALAAVPTTTAYQFSSHPMISGTVATVNDHQMVVNTDQGEQVTLEVDSRTMAPRDLAPGMVMRADFLALEDCRLYAQRIMAIRDGMPTHRLQAYANAEGRESLSRTMGEPSPGTMMTAYPATVDYQFSTRPMVSGKVVSVNDHRLLVETDQGQQVGLVMDSRTMVPGQVAPGTIMRAEFMPMKDGRYYAKRISRVAGEVAGREHAYAHTRDSDTVIAGNVPDCGFVSATTPNTTMSAVERRGIVSTTPEKMVVQTAREPVVERPTTLPQTASQQPLMLLFGWFALGSAGVIGILRSHRGV